MSHIVAAWRIATNAARKSCWTGRRNRDVVCAPIPTMFRYAPVIRRRWWGVKAFTPHHLFPNSVSLRGRRCAKAVAVGERLRAVAHIFGAAVVRELRILTVGGTCAPSAGGGHQFGRQITSNLVL